MMLLGPLLPNRRAQIGLTVNQALHELQIAHGQSHGGVHPYFDHLQQLLILELLDATPCRCNAGQRIAIPASGLDEILHPGLATTLIQNQIHHPERQHIIGAIDFATGDQVFGGALAHFALQEGIGPHPWKQVEQNFRKSETRLTLRDQHVGGQSRLEATAQAFSLNQRNGRDRKSVSDVVSIQHFDAGTAVGEQCVAIPCLDQAHE